MEKLNLNTISGFTNTLAKYEKSIKHLLQDKYGISAEEFFVTCVNAVKKNPKLLNCHPSSLFGSILLCAECGLKPNTPDQHVFIIPYVLNDYTVGGCFPVKFHDGLAAGLPVVVTDLPAYLPFKDVSYISKTFEEFSNNIEKALKEDSPEKIKARQQVAKENNWDGKVAKMLSLIKETQKN